MLSKLATRPHQLLARRSHVLSAPMVQKRSTGDVVNKFTPHKGMVFVKNAITNEQISKELEELFEKIPGGYLDSNYKSKYPDIPFEKYNAEFEEDMKKPFYFSENLIELGEDLMGFTKKELMQGASHDTPKFTLEDGDLDIIAFANYFTGFTKANDDLVNGLVKRITEGPVVTRLLKNPPPIPPPESFKNLSTETKAEIDALMEMVPACAPIIDVDAVVSKLESMFGAIQDQLKDLLIENLDDVKSNNKELEFLSHFLDADEDGLPKTDIESFEFWETHFPDVIEDVIEEIELGHWDIEQRDQDPRITKVGPETLFLKNRDWAIKQYTALDDKLESDMAISASVTEEQKNFQILYHEVMGVARYNKELEAEIGQLKFMLGGEEESSEKKKESESLEDEGDDAIVDKVLAEIMEDKSPKLMGDEKHKQNEAVKSASLKQIRNLLAGYDADYEGPVTVITGLGK